MSSVQILAGLGNGLFVLAMLAVSVRLLRLWWRTRQLPELTVGAGFFLVAAVGFPLVTAGGLGRLGRTGLVLPLVALGMAAIGLGIVALHVFTWRVFRPEQGWAAALSAASMVGAAAVCAGAVHALGAAPPESDATETVRAAAFWWVALRMLFQVWYLWTGVESLLEYGRARRRLALGLSDPVVVNRFLLWGAMGIILTAANAVALVLEQRGLSPVSDPLSALVLGANGLAAGTLMLLTFLPPHAYLDRVRRRAATAEA